MTALNTIAPVDMTALPLSSNDAIYCATHDATGYTVTIFYDHDPMSPREWDNLGTIIGWHRRYTLSDADAPAFHDPDAFHSWLRLNPCVCLPVYMYDHSGISLNTTGYGCPWDSGQVGYIYVTLERIRSEYGVKRVSPQLRQKVERILRDEIATYSAYMNGEVYGYTITDDEGDIIDSCSGYIGEPEYCLSEAVNACQALACTQDAREGLN